MTYTDPFPPTDPPRVDGVILSHLIPVVFGDWSGDGHEGTSRQYFWSNQPVSVWRQAVYAGECKVGISLQKICSGYEETTVDASVVAKLRTAGFAQEFEGCVEEDQQGISPYDFECIFFFLLVTGNPRILYQRIEHGSHHQEVHPGGYGLYGS